LPAEEFYADSFTYAAEAEARTGPSAAGA